MAISQKELKSLATETIEKFKDYPFSVTDKTPDNVDDYLQHSDTVYFGHKDNGTNDTEFLDSMEKEILIQLTQSLENMNIHIELTEEIDFIDMEGCENVAKEIIDNIMKYDNAIISPMILTVIQGFMSDKGEAKFVRSSDGPELYHLPHVGQMVDDDDEANTTMLYCSSLTMTQDQYIVYNDGDIIFEIHQPNVNTTKDHGESTIHLEIPCTIFANENLEKSTHQ